MRRGGVGPVRSLFDGKPHRPSSERSLRDGILNDLVHLQRSPNALDNRSINQCVILDLITQLNLGSRSFQRTACRLVVLQVQSQLTQLPTNQSHVPDVDATFRVDSDELGSVWGKEDLMSLNQPWIFERGKLAMCILIKQANPAWSCQGEEVA